MLSASAYSFRQKSRLAISLSWVAGYTNVITFIVCAVVTSHATGNVTHFGQFIAESLMGRRGAGVNAMYFGCLVLSFFMGAVVSAIMTEGARRQGVASKYILPMAVHALLLCALALLLDYYGHRSLAGETLPLYAVSGVASFAMGLQNATITKVSGAVVRTTHLTGVVTDLGLEGVQYLLWAWDKTRGRRQQRLGRVLFVSRRHPTTLRILLLASIVASFLFGVVAGTLVYAHWPAYALVAPIAFLLWILYMDWRRPIADVKELDLFADPEYPGYADLRPLLPPELGIYRLSHHRRDAVHHAPDFQLWVDRLPQRWRVVILAVSPLTHFDNDESLDLLAALQKLRARRKDLIVCGANRVQFKVLHASGLIDALGMENVCPDLDLAIARGMNLAGAAAGGRGGEPAFV